MAARWDTGCRRDPVWRNSVKFVLQPQAKRIDQSCLLNNLRQRISWNYYLFETAAGQIFKSGSIFLGGLSTEESCFRGARRGGRLSLEDSFPEDAGCRFELKCATLLVLRKLFCFTTLEFEPFGFGFLFLLLLFCFLSYQQFKICLLCSTTTYST